MTIRTLPDLMGDPALHDEILNAARSIVDGWYPEGRIDWDDVWDRLDGSELSNGDRLDLGDDLLLPELRKIKHWISHERRG